MKINKTGRHPGIHKMKIPNAPKLNTKIAMPKMPKATMPKMPKLYGF